MVLIFAKNLTSSFPFCFNIFLLLLYLHFNILLLLSYFLYLLYTVNQFSFTHFRYCVSTFSYKHMPQCKFSLYLKKARLASRNIVHFFKKSHSTLYRSLLSLSWFLSRFGLKTGIDFDHYGHKSCMVYKGTTGPYKRICLFNSK